MLKRMMAFAAALIVSVSSTLTVSAQSEWVSVTDADYSQIIVGGVDGYMLFSAYDDNGDYVIGTMNAQGEQSREGYSSARWDALVEDDPWKMTVMGDAAALCPYAHTHVETTVCPYTDIDLVTMTNTVTGVTLENYYIPTKSLVVFPSGGAHICWGRYGFVSPVSLKWDEESRYMSLKNKDGLWGVFDTQTDSMVTTYQYADMSAVYGCYAKVYDGTAWGRLDLSGATDTVYAYTDEDDFSVTEELRVVADGQWQVFNADNEAISVVFDGAFAKTSYAPTAHLLHVTYSDQTQEIIDLGGHVVASFDADTTVTYLQETCYAVKTQIGVALARVDGVVQPDDTVTKGDVNFDAQINSSDVRQILRYIVGDIDLTARAQIAAQFVEDDSVDTTDARELLGYILNH